MARPRPVTKRGGIYGPALADRSTTPHHPHCPQSSPDGAPVSTPERADRDALHDVAFQGREGVERAELEGRAILQIPPALLVLPQPGFHGVFVALQYEQVGKTLTPATMLRGIINYLSWS